METLVGQRHRCGLAWVDKKSGCEGSSVLLRGEPIFFGMSVKNENIRLFDSKPGLGLKFVFS